MNPDALSLMQSCIDRHSDAIAPGSIEETSLHTAASMFAQGQSDVALQIIDSLLIDEAVKAECRSVFENTEETKSEENSEGAPAPETTVPSPTLSPETIKEPFINEPLVAAPPAPMAVPIVEQPVASPPVAPPIPPQAAPAPAEVAPPMPVPIVEEAPIMETPPVAPQEPAPAPVSLNSPDTLLVAEDPLPPVERLTQDADAVGESTSIGIDNSVWDNFNTIVQEEKNNTQASDEALSHLERLEQLPKELVEAGDDVEADQDKKITEDYDHVFGGDAHTSGFEVPGVIKTYAPAQSMIEKDQRELESGKQDRLTKQKKYFDAGEQYLKRAYTSGNSDVMNSARAQFESLKERYPEYTQERAAHIADMQAIIDHHNAARAEAVMHESYQLNEDTLIAPGIRVSGDQDTYVITSIIQPTPDHGAEIVFTADTSKQLYHVPAEQLSKALIDPNLRTDEFFAGFTQSS